MYDKDSNVPGSPNSDNETHKSVEDYLKSADQAHMEGSDALSLHLYLIAYEKACASSAAPSSEAIDGLHKAWNLACLLKERSLAEYIFEKLEPYLTGNQIAEHAEALQQLALDKLEEFGFSRDDLQDMADMVSDDLASGSGLMQVTPDALMAGPFMPTKKTEVGSAESTKPPLPIAKEKSASSPDVQPQQKSSLPSEKDAARTSTVEKDDSSVDKVEQRVRFSDLVGFGRAIENLKSRGMGMSEDAEFQNFISLLSKRHGISHVAAADTLLFRSYAREDADQLMEAAMGEMHLPTVRMRVEQNQQGLPVLCVMASSEFKSRMHFIRSGFEGPGVLMLEDIDTWGAPLSGGSDDMDMAALGQLSRGARDAIMLIRSAVDNPEVTVMASCSTERTLEEFFCMLLEPMDIIDIDIPNAQEREEVWQHAAALYPSLRFLDMLELVRLSAHMSRYDIYMAAREAVEEAYRASVESHTYMAVSRATIFEKIAAYQPLESSEYRQLEDAAVESLRDQIDGYENLLKESGQ